MAELQEISGPGLSIPTASDQGGRADHTIDALKAPGVEPSAKGLDHKMASNDPVNIAHIGSSRDIAQKLFQAGTRVIIFGDTFHDIKSNDDYVASQIRATKPDFIFIEESYDSQVDFDRGDYVAISKQATLEAAKATGARILCVDAHSSLKDVGMKQYETLRLSTQASSLEIDVLDKQIEVNNKITHAQTSLKKEKNLNDDQKLALLQELGKLRDNMKKLEEFRRTEILPMRQEVTRMNEETQRKGDMRDAQVPSIASGILSREVAEFRKREGRDPLIIGVFGNAHLSSPETIGHLDEAIAKATGLDVKTLAVYSMDLKGEGESFITENDNKASKVGHHLQLQRYGRPSARKFAYVEKYYPGNNYVVTAPLRPDERGSQDAIELEEEFSSIYTPTDRESLKMK